MSEGNLVTNLQQQFNTEPATSKDIEHAMVNKLGLLGDGTRSFVEVSSSFLTAVGKQSADEQLSSLSILARPLVEAVWIFDEESELSSGYRATLGLFSDLALELLNSDVVKELPTKESFQAAGICLSVMAANAGQKSIAQMLQHSDREIRCTNSDCSDYMGDEIKCPKCGSYCSADSMFTS